MASLGRDRFGPTSVTFGHGPARARPPSLRFGLGWVPYRCILAPFWLGSVVSRFESGSASARPLSFSMSARFDPIRLQWASPSLGIWLGSLSARVGLAPIRPHSALISVAFCLASFAARSKSFSATLDRDRVRFESVSVRCGLGWAPPRFALGPDGRASLLPLFVLAPIRFHPGPFSNSVRFCITPLPARFDSAEGRYRPLQISIWSTCARTSEAKKLS